MQDSQGKHKTNKQTNKQNKQTKTKTNKKKKQTDKIKNNNKNQKKPNTFARYVRKKNVHSGIIVPECDIYEFKSMRKG